MAYKLKSDVRQDRQDRLSAMKDAATISMQLQKMGMEKKQADTEAVMAPYRNMAAIKAAYDAGLIPADMAQSAVGNIMGVSGIQSTAPSVMPSTQPMAPAQAQQNFISVGGRVYPNTQMPRFTSQGGQVQPIAPGQQGGIGVPTLPGMDYKQMREAQNEAVKQQIQAGGAAETTRQKTAQESQINTDAARASTSGLMDAFLNYSNEQYERFKLKPGTASGIISKLSPNEMNKYKDAFIGAGVENAAQVAAVSIPGVRAARVVDLFKNYSPDVFSTIESGIEDSAQSWASAVSKDAIQNPQDYGISQFLPREEILRQANMIANESAKKFKDNYYIKVYNTNKNLFSDKKTKKYVEKLISSKEYEQSRLDDLRKKILGGD